MCRHFPSSQRLNYGLQKLVQPSDENHLHMTRTPSILKSIKIKLQEDHLVSFDVGSLLTYILLDETLTFVTNKLKISKMCHWYAKKHIHLLI